MKNSLCAALAALGLVLPAAAQEGRLVRFGLITDVHICDKPDQSPMISVNAGPRYFTGGLAKTDLAANRLPTVVLTHQLLNPEEQVDKDFDPKHTVRNAAEVRTLLEKSGNVLAVFAGHYHDGGYQQVGGIHYVTLQANAAYGNDSSYHNQYATVEVSSEGGGAALGPPPR
jgi:hypothetical protein